MMWTWGTLLYVAAGCISFGAFYEHTTQGDDDVVIAFLAGMLWPASLLILLGGWLGRKLKRRTAEKAPIKPSPIDQQAFVKAVLNPEAPNEQLKTIVKEDDRG